MAKKSIDFSLIAFAAIAVGTGVACYVDLGRNAFLESLQGDIGLLAFVAPKLGAAMLVAAFVQILLPPRVFARMMGPASGMKGMAIASAAGTVTPGGPMTSFPIVTVLRDSGTGRGSLVAYVTAWSTNGLQRVFVWEVPLMGVEFALLRVLVAMPLGIVAGLVVRMFPEEEPVRPDEEA